MSASLPTEQRRLLKSLIAVVIVIALVAVSFLAGLAVSHLTTQAFAGQVPMTFSTKTVNGYGMSFWNFTLDLTANGRDPGSTHLSFELSVNNVSEPINCLFRSNEVPAPPWVAKGLQANLGPTCIFGPTNALVAVTDWRPPASGGYSWAFNRTLTENEVRITGLMAWTVTGWRFP